MEFFVVSTKNYVYNYVHYVHAVCVAPQIIIKFIKRALLSIHFIMK